MYAKMNEALKLCNEWATAYGLKISPEKTSHILFTKKHKKNYKIPKTGIIVNGEKISKETDVKYLGININHKLNWGPHINNKCKSLFCSFFFI